MKPYISVCMLMLLLWLSPPVAVFFFCKTFQNGYDPKTIKQFFLSFSKTKMFSRRSSTQRLGLQVNLPLACFSNEKSKITL